MDDIFIMYSFAFCEEYIFFIVIFYIFSCVLPLIRLFNFFLQNSIFNACTPIDIVFFWLIFLFSFNCVPRLWRQMPFYTLLSLIVWQMFSVAWQMLDWNWNLLNAEIWNIVPFRMDVHLSETSQVLLVVETWITWRKMQNR